ncbi:inner membrane protein YhjD [Amycolatopsis sp. WAC 01375]|uniref:YhjD/YihY/BrkB family envelope integrity protein n=1 Tax=unclassified Amycolatopsis TaxID=2618356 RepID=UPI000F7AA832|nr:MULTISPECIES: YhjD/YihY/BrkB family envelope integrity protein [unclassified Amycolatopsis]RSM71280.1 inner membrane protein YhjD [Amycolatopsis sp. WAC 01375]RSN36062.1 inner membrane protein YhjD [Amycolatopsis sp. WAC 01416]
MAKDDGAKPEEDKLLPRLRRKYGWLDHLIRANDAFTERYGNHYAAAITYFSVLSVIPILMVAFAIIKIVLAGDQVVTNQLVDGIKKSVPEGLSDLVGSIIKAALDSGGGIGVFGLLLALYSGVGWMSNLRDALTAQWGQEKQKLPLVSTTIKDLLSLVGLGLALVVSFGLTAAGSGVGRLLLELVGLEKQGWAVFLLKVATILLGLLANTLVFLWVIARLPREHVALRSAVKGAVFASVGFIVLQQAATFYLGSVTKSPAFALFGPVIGLLVFANLVSRFLLFVTAWTATATENLKTVIEPPAPVLIHPRVTVQQGPGLGAVGGAFATGALLGWFGRRKS